MTDSERHLVKNLLDNLEACAIAARRAGPSTTTRHEELVRLEDARRAIVEWAEQCATTPRPKGPQARHREALWSMYREALAARVHPARRSRISLQSAEEELRAHLWRYGVDQGMEDRCGWLDEPAAANADAQGAT